MQLEDFVSSRRFAAWLAPAPSQSRLGARNYGYQHTN
jgi:hypothetical protein